MRGLDHVLCKSVIIPALKALVAMEKNSSEGNLTSQVDEFTQNTFFLASRENVNFVELKLQRTWELGPSGNRRFWCMKWFPWEITRWIVFVHMASSESFFKTPFRSHLYNSTSVQLLTTSCPFLLCPQQHCTHTSMIVYATVLCNYIFAHCSSPLNQKISGYRECDLAVQSPHWLNVWL